MGADLILAWAPVPEGMYDDETHSLIPERVDQMRELIRERCLAADQETIDEVAEEALYTEVPSNFDEVTPLSDWAEWYAYEVVRAFDAATEGGRDLDIVRIAGGGPVFITGGMSWGDEPTEASAPLRILDASGVLELDPPWVAPKDTWSAVTRSMGCVQIMCNGKHMVNTPFELLTKSQASSLAAWINREDLA